MGCCASVLSRETSEASDHPESTSIEGRAQALATAAPETPAEATASRRTSRTANVALNEHYNEPVRLHIWKSKRRTWTRGQLDRERREFFETRVTGHAEVWAAISTAIELMRAGDLVTAQSILDAAGITVPTGDLCQGCYDQQGALYRLPQCIVSDPTNMVQTDTSTATESQDAIEQDEDEEALSDGKLATDDASGDELISEDMERRRDEKGKTSERDLIRVRVRLSDRGGPDLVLMIGKGQSVGFLARKVRQEAEISSVQSVRIAYLGCMLKEQQSLPDQGWEPGHIVNAFVVPRRGFNE